MQVIEWQPGATLNNISADEIHVYNISIAESKSFLPALAENLTSQEQQEVARFHFKKDRIRATLSRACLREILACYLHCSARSIALTKTDFGKPVFTEAQAINFNVTHSGDRILVAISRFAMLGVDVEDCSRQVEYKELAQRFFSQSEAQALLQLEDSELQQAFYRIWTRKEAFIKAVGEGLSYPLAEFSVSVADEPETRLIELQRQPEQIQRWFFCSFQPGEDYQAAIAFMR